MKNTKTPSMMDHTTNTNVHRKHASTVNYEQDENTIDNVEHENTIQDEANIKQNIIKDDTREKTIDMQSTNTT